jgi:hypothetical protein
MSCRLIDTYLYFGGTCGFHLQGIVKKGVMGFSKTLVPNLPKYLVSHYGSHCHCYDNLKSQIAYASYTFLGTLELRERGAQLQYFLIKL